MTAGFLSSNRQGSLFVFICFYFYYIYYYVSKDHRFGNSNNQKSGLRSFDEGKIIKKKY
jgi:hypothetical protein